MGLFTDDSRDPGAVLLPFSRWWPLFAGAVVGVALRLVFMGRDGEPYAPMMIGFIFFSPTLVGAVTVYVAERTKRRSWGYYFGASFLANLFYVLGTLLINVEGLICVLLIAPLFATFGALGGLAMGLVCRYTNRPKGTLLSVGALPLLLGALETGLPFPDRIATVERTVVVGAAPAEVWERLFNTNTIAPEAIEQAWVFRIGVPLPLSGTTRRTPEGLVRRVHMGKQVYFDEVISDVDEHRSVRWTYRFYPDSFPPRALDDHVVIGGHYFDVRETEYTLRPVDSSTELTVRIEYRVSTRFNWYAGPLAELLIGDLAEANLEYYRKQGEAVESTARR